MADAAAMAKANEPVPDMVKQFVVYFYRHIREKNGACRTLRCIATDAEGGAGGLRTQHKPTAPVQSGGGALPKTHRPPNPPFFSFLFFNDLGAKWVGKKLSQISSFSLDG